jgi:hypothetical protein
MTSFAPAVLSASGFRPRRWSAESSGARSGARTNVVDVPAGLEQRGGWLGGALERLAALAELERGWDDARAPAISSALIEVVRRFLTTDAVSGLAVRPDIVPTLKGGLMLEWHTEVLDFIIEPTLEGTSSFYFSNSMTGEEVEAPLGQRMDLVASAFNALAQ